MICNIVDSSMAGPADAFLAQVVVVVVVTECDDVDGNDGFGIHVEEE